MRIPRAGLQHIIQPFSTLHSGIIVLCDYVGSFQPSADLLLLPGFIQK
jgi:hypothetical protein